MMVVALWMMMTLITIVKRVKQAQIAKQQLQRALFDLNL